MAETKIAWCNYTFNPWRGCTKVSEGCAHCYAEQFSHRNPKVLGEWGPHGKRAMAVPGYWKEPHRWDEWARREGRRARVFCASLADVFEDRVELIEPLARLLRLIHLTPHLDWLLLTKRPQEFTRRMQLVAHIAPTLDQEINDGAELAQQWLYGSNMPNVWVGVSVENQQRADERIPELLKIPATVRFLSCEPLLSPLVLEPWLGNATCWNEDGSRCWTVPGINWVIVGGESGGMESSRPFHLEWARSLVRQCHEASIPVFVKQMGSTPVLDYYPGDNISSADDPDELEWAQDRELAVIRFDHGNAFRHNYRDGQPPRFSLRVLRFTGKGDDASEWPTDLRVQQFPEVPHA